MSHRLPVVFHCFAFPPSALLNRLQFAVAFFETNLVTRENDRALIEALKCFGVHGPDGCAFPTILDALGEWYDVARLTRAYAGAR